MSAHCTNDLHTPLAVGSVVHRNRVWLAPMSGVTDVPFRCLAWEHGAGAVVSEMVASQAFTTGQEEMRLKAEGAGLPVHVVQLAGNDPRWMAEATRLAEAAGAHAIDINMGCPARKVTTGWSGSALMRDLDHAERLLDAVVAAATVPVTLKMRLGWDANTINAPELARRAEGAGIRLLTVHGRTRCQFYKGHADWGAVRAVREATSLPLVVNGDVAGRADAERARVLSGGDAVMIGRAAYGRPWLPGEIAGGAGLCEPLADLVLRHHEAMLAHYGTAVGLRVARKHLGWYADGCDLPPDRRPLRAALLREVDSAVIRRTIRDLFDGLAPRADAPLAAAA